MAAAYLRGTVEAPRYAEGVVRRLAKPVSDLCASPDGPRDRQLLRGEAVTVYDDHAGWSFVQAEDGYVGYVASARLAELAPPTHRVATFATHAYRDDDLKSAEVAALPFGARVRVSDERRTFYETDAGLVPKPHLRPLDRPFTDPATIAQLHYNVPYLWGGNSTRGIDCSGLVSAAFRACGIDCPADSDVQRAGLGDVLPPGAALTRGDLVFWPGHVGMMVDAETLLHANAHHMAVRYEPLATAVARIAAQGGGDVLCCKRVARAA